MRSSAPIHTHKHTHTHTCAHTHTNRRALIGNVRHAKSHTHHQRSKDPQTGRTEEETERERERERREMKREGGTEEKRGEIQEDN